MGPLYFDESQFGASSLVDGIPMPGREAVAGPSALAGVVRAHRLVIGHFSVESLLAAGCTAIAIQVREPRARVLSLYRYWQAQPEDERSSWGPWGTEVVAKSDLPLRDFLRSPNVLPAIGNAIAYQALAHRPARHSVFRRHSTITRRSDHLGKRGLIMDWSTSSKRFLMSICESLGAATVPSLGRENITEVAGGEQTIDRSTRRLLARVTNVDRLFLDHMSREGALPKRAPADLDMEFEATATKLNFRIS